MPGRPPGNVEYNLCRAYLPGAPSVTRCKSAYAKAEAVETLYCGIFYYHFWGMELGRGMRFLEFNDSAAEANGNGLGSIAGSELFHDVFDVHFYSLFRDE
jgi:hypothetical protein